MCAVVGCYLQNPNSDDFDLVSNVLLESSIRGLHATGVSWVRDGKIHTHIEKLPAKGFLRNFDIEKTLNEDGNLYMVGHCRYSTSDLNYNQPLYNDNISIVHNGVVSQEMPENWERIYGYKCSTRNDSELILHTLESKKSPLSEFSEASMAVIELYNDKKIRFYRNGKRPIYFTSVKNGSIIMSTKNIAIRAKLESPKEVPMNVYLTTVNGSLKIEKVIIENAKDLQHV